MTDRRVRFQSGDTALVAAARAVADVLTGAGHQALFAGGCVRDALLGRPLKDVDLATSARPEQVEALFRGRTVAVGRAFGVVLVRQDGFSFDVATFRSDGAYTDGRHPDGVAFATAEEDAQRRDFTVNGMFCRPEDGAVLDTVGGLDDLDARVLRAIGDPQARFREDRLRLLRAVRFVSVLGFTLDPETRQAVEANAAQLGAVSVERVASEFLRLLCESPRPSVGLSLLRETGLLAQFLPEVVALHGTAQPPQYHPEGDVWTHTCLMLDGLPAPREPELALGVLLHDIGKPATSNGAQEAGALRFPNHAAVGAELAEALLRRLRQPAARVAAVRDLVAGHMRFVEAERMRRAKLRRLLGAERFDRLLELLRLDTQHSNGDFTKWRFLKEAYDSFRTEPVLPPPLVRGRDLLAWGVPPGPGLGALLTELYDAQLEGRVNTVEEARAACTALLASFCGLVGGPSN